MIPVIPRISKIFQDSNLNILPRPQGFAGMVETVLRLPHHVPTVAEVETIAAIPDPVTRNLQITMAYHDLNHAMGARLGCKNANWCSFTTWASKTAGAFIRGERSSLSVQEYLEHADYVKQALAHLNKVLVWFNQSLSLKPAFLATIIDQITDEVAANIGHGNRIVFAEMAPFFADFLDTIAHNPTYDQAKLDSFLNRHFIPGPLAEGGQDMLRSAFTYYYKALFEPEAKMRAELVLLANLSIGYHEQTRLQEAIARAINAPLEMKLETAPVEATQRWLEANLPSSIAGLIWLIWQTPLRLLARHIANDWRTIMTRWFMTIKLPAETLRLGQDVSHIETGMFPEELCQIEHPVLSALLQELDETPNSSLGSAANDWGCLRDRMNYLVDFFRSRQQDGRLYQQPFCDAQVAVIRAGGIPSGPL